MGLYGFILCSFRFFGIWCLRGVTICFLCIVDDFFCVYCGLAQNRVLM